MASLSIDVIAFDADDTLWHNEPIFTETKRKFEQLLANYHGEEWINLKLDETEVRNIQHFGYGIKGFTLSMIETAIELTEGRISGREIGEIIGFSRQMMHHPVDLLDGVRETVALLAASHKLMLITKGDLFDQEAKIARSDLGDYFSSIEIVSEKNTRVYREIMERHAIDPERFLMVGNSIKSDVLPVIEAGGSAVHIPYPSTWFHEKLDGVDLEHVDFFELEHIKQLPAFLNGR